MTMAPTLVDGDVGCIRIGLVNNMPDSALEATERQFQTLLSEAAEGMSVQLAFLAIPQVPRSLETKRRIDSLYLSIDALWDQDVDGLIVSGAEPVAPNLMDEPFWESLAQLVDWAQHNTYSSVWSCLAAQAAVLHIDGIPRRRLGDKLFGVFECANISEHHLTSGSPDSFGMPHSRWNDIPENELSACGYGVLTRLKNGLVDTFVKKCKSLFVFCQGHPEYEPASLLLEYRRDIRRYLRGERETYPSMPEGYFDQHAAATLSELRVQAFANRSEQCLSNFSASLQPARIRSTWRPQAVRFYRNWLHYLSERKAMRAHTRPRRAAAEYSFKSSAAAASAV